jgi:hypothetical protein
MPKDFSETAMNQTYTRGGSDAKRRALGSRTRLTLAISGGAQSARRLLSLRLVRGLQYLQAASRRATTAASHC